MTYISLELDKRQIYGVCGEDQNDGIACRGLITVQERSLSEIPFDATTSPSVSHLYYLSLSSIMVTELYGVMKRENKK